MQETAAPETCVFFTSVFFNNLQHSRLTFGRADMQAPSGSGGPPLPDGPPEKAKSSAAPKATKQIQLNQITAMDVKALKFAETFPKGNVVFLVQSGLSGNWGINRCLGPEASRLLDLPDKIIQLVQRQRLVNEGKAPVPFITEHEDLGDLNERDMTLAFEVIKCIRDKGYICSAGADLATAWLRGGAASESRLVGWL